MLRNTNLVAVLEKTKSEKIHDCRVKSLKTIPYLCLVVFAWPAWAAARTS